MILIPDLYATEAEKAGYNLKTLEKKRYCERQGMAAKSPMLFMAFLVEKKKEVKKLELRHIDLVRHHLDLGHKIFTNLKNVGSDRFREMAREMGISKSMVCQTLLVYRHVKDATTAKSVCRAYGKNITWKNLKKLVSHKSETQKFRNICGEPLKEDEMLKIGSITLKDVVLHDVIIENKEIEEKIVSPNKDKKARAEAVPSNKDMKAKAIEMLKQGEDSRDVAKTVGLKPAQVRAYLAHIGMGTYGK